MENPHPTRNDRRTPPMSQLAAYVKDLAWVRDVGITGFSPSYSTRLGAAFCGDSLELLRALPGATIDLVMTSPPFALTRKKEYGNEPIDRYIDWFMPFCSEIKRVLKPTGSFVW